MNISIPTIGTRGDVQPFIALAQGLNRAGHAVTLASHPVMRELVESYDVKFAPIGPDIDLGEEVAAIRLRSRNVIAGLVRAMRFSFDILEQSHEDILALCAKADLVVISVQSAAGKNEADQLDLPHLSVTLMPWGIPWNDPARPLIKRMAYGAIDGSVRLITTRPLNRIRKRQGLPPVGPEGFTSKRLNLIPVSPVIYTPEPLWEPQHRVVGYLFAEEPGGWEPPADLLAFLGSGEPPIVVSLGAMSLGDDDALEAAGLFVGAIQQAGVRAIIQGWDAGLKQMSTPSTILAAGSMPHSWLLPHSSGIVHHGGFGTTAAGFRAGIPQLVIPHIVDQFYWGQRVHDLGVGLKPIPRTKLDSDGLADALDKLAHNDVLRAEASRIGEQIQSENGVKNAVHLIEETFS
ncbi:MAG: glycosyltransferase [Anaerolineales bacterium]